MAWRLTNGLQNLRAQVNAKFPDRDRSSDGSIGDTAHQARTSGHNPDDTPGARPAWEDADDDAEVRAWDCDADLRAGVTAQQLVDHIRGLSGVGSAIRYIIYNRRIYHSRSNFAPEPYSGDNPHDKHIHFEGAWSQQGDESRFDYRLSDLTGDDVTPEDIRAIAEATARAVWSTPITDFADRATPQRQLAAGTWLGYSDHRHRTTEARVAAAIAGLDAVDEQAVATAVLAVLTPQAIAAALPAEVAEQVAQELADRLSS